MDKNNILISSLNVENISAKELTGTSSVDLIKRDDFDKLVSKCEVSFNEKEQNKVFSIVEDRYISKEEILSLSYEEIKELKNLIIEEDENGKIYDASSGRTWDTFAQINDEGKLYVCGFWKFSWIGKSLYFTRI